MATKKKQISPILKGCKGKQNCGFLQWRWMLAPLEEQKFSLQFIENWHYHSMRKTATKTCYYIMCQIFFSRQAPFLLYYLFDQNFLSNTLQNNNENNSSSGVPSVILIFFFVLVYYPNIIHFFQKQLVLHCF